MMSTLDRPDVEKALSTMQTAMQENRASSGKESLKVFNYFVGVMLALLMAVTTISFVYTMRAEQQAATAALERVVVFETYSTDILDEIRQMQGVLEEDIDEIAKLIEKHAD